MPSVSVVIPTLNAAGVLATCLDSIVAQDYPKEKLEVVIADGGSTDGTVAMAEKYHCRVVPNRLVTAEAGKAAGARAAANDVLAFIDSDNILPDGQWLQRMVEPFVRDGVLGSEPLYYTYRREDAYITRYCALIGMNDPLCLFLGNYDRWCLITNRWTGLAVHQEDKGSYLLLELENAALPTMGANGFLVRRDVLMDIGFEDYLFDIDAIYSLVTKGKNRFAKVKVGIIHLYSKTASNFMRKQRRRIRDYSYYKSLNIRRYPWSARPERLLAFALCSITVAPLLYQALQGYRRKADPAWWFHVPACWITLFTYALGAVQNRVSPRIENRSGWKQ